MTLIGQAGNNMKCFAAAIMVCAIMGMVGAHPEGKNIRPSVNAVRDTMGCLECYDNCYAGIEDVCYSNCDPLCSPS